VKLQLRSVTDSWAIHNGRSTRLFEPCNYTPYVQEARVKQLHPNSNSAPFSRPIWTSTMFNQTTRARSYGRAVWMYILYLGRSNARANPSLRWRLGGSDYRQPTFSLEQVQIKFSQPLLLGGCCMLISRLIPNKTPRKLKVLTSVFWGVSFAPITRTLRNY
jgi:hypothetical protein